MVDVTMKPIEKVAITHAQQKTIVLKELAEHQRLKISILEIRGTLTKKSPITEARLRAVNKRIDECEKEILHMDEVMEELVTKVQVLAQKTIEKVKKVQQDRLEREL